MLKLENRNSKFDARNLTCAKAGVYEVVDSRLRGNDPLDGFRVSNFDFRVSVFES